MTIRVPRPSEQATQEFVADLVERLKLLPQVRRVLVETEGGVPRVWTVIEAEPWEFSPRRPVDDAELEAMMAHPEIEANFRLINIAERPVSFSTRYSRPMTHFCISNSSRAERGTGNR